MISKLDTKIKIINFIVNFIPVFLNHFPFLNGTGLRGEVDSDSVELSLIRSIFLGITPLLYLFQRLLCTPIQLEFKNVNIIPRLYYTIHSSLTLLLLRLCIENPSPCFSHASNTVFPLKTISRASLTPPLLLPPMHPAI